ncbi:MAG: hypothetical protein FWC20_01650 [Oscillospiraceae bacterium]|nr:hypothetical protein [Oscillospiraceae bacterium]MCL2278098.1 hypothetical protein [Oscillospiraceae bacterium]
MTLTGLTRTTYTLDSVPIGSGGEGDIYRIVGDTDVGAITNRPQKVAKIYKDGVLNQELAEKLNFMIDNPPNDTVLTQVAWPLDMLGGADGKVCGFVMPELSINAELGEIYKYPATLPISTQCFLSQRIPALNYCQCKRGICGRVLLYVLMLFFQIITCSKHIFPLNKFYVEVLLAVWYTVRVEKFECCRRCLRWKLLGKLLIAHC